MPAETEQPDPRDVRAWDRYVRGLLDDDQIELVKRHFRESQAAALFEVGARSGRTAGPLPRAAQRRFDLLWRAWCLDVLQIDLDLRPGGRAVLRHPADTYRVEIVWHYDDKAPRSASSQRGKITSIRVLAEPGEWLVTGPRLAGMAELTDAERNEVETTNWIGWPLKRPTDVDQFMARLNLHLLGPLGDVAQLFETLPKQRPRPGQRMDIDHYKRIVAVADELTKRGARDPAAQLAEQMGEKASTMRGWIHRGRRYIAEEAELRTTSRLQAEDEVTKAEVTEEGETDGRER